MSDNTLFLRLEGPLQAWGVQESKFAIRRSADSPTKSGIIGLLCAAMGLDRQKAGQRLAELGSLRIAVRVDWPGVRWWDYHTVGAGMDMPIAEGANKTKPGAMLTRREYLADASFLVALQGSPQLIAELSSAIKRPVWTPYLGRKSCPPSRPLDEYPPGLFHDPVSALASIRYRKRLESDEVPATLDCLSEWISTPSAPEAPEDAQTWYDVPICFDPPAYMPRLVVRQRLQVGEAGEVRLDEQSSQSRTPAPPRPRADYGNSEYRKQRDKRLRDDRDLCVFCKQPATTVQHKTYRDAGGDEKPEQLCSLCRLCHDAVTMIEYGLGMGLDRIDPEDPQWRQRIMEKRQEIVAFRSLQTRRRRLEAPEVE